MSRAAFSFCAPRVIFLEGGVFFRKPDFDAEPAGQSSRLRGAKRLSGGAKV